MKEVEGGRTVKAVCRQYGIAEGTYYTWKSKYGGREFADVKRLKELEEENRRLKQMYADLSLDHKVLKDIVDDFSREALAIEIDVGLSAERVTRVLDRVVAWRGYPSKLRIDTGPEFISTILADSAEDQTV